MSDKRMAGDKLDEPTKASADAKEALSTSQRNKQIREEIGNDPERLAERISVVDREKYDFDGFTDKEINMALQGGEFGDKDYARLTGKSVGGDDSSSPTPSPEVGEDPKPVAPVTPPAMGEQDQWMDVPGGAPGATNIQQDNDQTSTVTGDNNTVNQNQDTSIGYLGGFMKKHNFFKN